MDDTKFNDKDDDKQGGRRLKGDGPSFPQEEVDRLLVHGEMSSSDDGLNMYVAYPSYREIANRYGVAHSLIAAFAKTHNCMLRRKQAQARVQEMADSKLIEMRADALAVTRDDQIRTIDRFLLSFEEALAENRVRVDSPADFNTLCRLKAYLLGEADSRQEIYNGLPTLEELQARHARMLAEMQDATPEMCGIVRRSPDEGVTDDVTDADADDSADWDDDGDDDTAPAPAKPFN